MQRSSLHSLFAQLQSRYPTAAIVTELLQVHDGNYVARASVRVSGTTLTTGMAAAPQIELAEDQAIMRSLALLGIQPEPTPFSVPAIQPLPSFPAVVGETAPFSQPTEKPIPSLDGETTAFSPVSPIAEEPALPVPSLPIIPESSSDTGNLDLDSPAIEPPKPAPEPVTTPTSRSKSRSQSKTVSPVAETVAEPALPTNEPVDFSDPIAQIDTEMMRVGWSKEQGRDYLKSTYKKRSRQQLSDDELLDFLSYLQSLPSTVETPF